jgi:hypothetical protein
LIAVWIDFIEVFDTYLHRIKIRSRNVRLRFCQLV